MTATEPTDWGVWVNEVGINAQCGGRDFWADFWLRANPKIMTTLTLSIAGGHFHVATPTEEDADFMRDYMIDKGIHKTFVKVQRLSAAQAAQRRREARARS